MRIRRPRRYIVVVPQPQPFRELSDLSGDAEPPNPASSAEADHEEARRQLRRELRRQCAAAILAALAFTTLFVVLDRDVRFLFLSAAHLLLFAAIALLGLGRRRRVGTARFCRTCDNELAPEGPWPADCPECGASWIAPGSLIVGRRIQWKGIQRAGLAVLVMFAALTVSQIRAVRSGRSFSVFPTSTLISQLSRDDENTLIDELKLRNMSPEVFRAYCLALFDYPIREGRYDSGLIELCEMFAMGALPPDLMDRFLDELYVLRLRAAPHRPDRIALILQNEHQGKFLAYPVRVQPPYIMVEYFRVGGEPLHSDVAVGLATAWPFFAERDDRRSEHILALIERGEASAIVVEVAFWIVVNGSGGPWTIERDSDGTPRVPASALWSKRIVMRDTVTLPGADP
jgi:hypothetical protein